MVYAHHPHLFSHDWFQSHPELLSRFKTYGPPLGLGALLVTIALFVWIFYSAMDMGLMAAAAMSALAEEVFVPTGFTGYLPTPF
jgi:hypothetical protein